MSFEIDIACACSSCMMAFKQLKSDPKVASVMQVCFLGRPERYYAL